MFKSSIVTFIGAAVIAGSVYAQQPAKCPDIDAIKAEGLTEVFPWEENKYLAAHLSSYDTEQQWMFVVGIIKAESEEEALSKGNAALPGLAGKPVPHPEGSDILCKYRLRGKEMAFAMHSDDMMSINTIKKHLTEY